MYSIYYNKKAVAPTKPQLSLFNFLVGDSYSVLLDFRIIANGLDAI